jgi:hypothetical protein
LKTFSRFRRCWPSIHGSIFAPNAVVCVGVGGGSLGRISFGSNCGGYGREAEQYQFESVSLAQPCKIVFQCIFKLK